MRAVPRGPIHAIDALERVEADLLTLLASLAPHEWDAPTIVSGWRVRHVAGHLLDTASRKLTIVRDGVSTERPTSGRAEDVRDFVNVSVRVDGDAADDWQLVREDEAARRITVMGEAALAAPALRAVAIVG